MVDHAVPGAAPEIGQLVGHPPIDRQGEVRQQLGQSLGAQRVLHPRDGGRVAVHHGAGQHHQAHVHVVYRRYWFQDCLLTAGAGELVQERPAVDHVADPTVSVRAPQRLDRLLAQVTQHDTALPVHTAQDHVAAVEHVQHLRPPDGAAAQDPIIARSIDPRDVSGPADRAAEVAQAFDAQRAEVRQLGVPLRSGHRAAAVEGDHDEVFAPALDRLVDEALDAAVGHLALEPHGLAVGLLRVAVDADADPVQRRVEQRVTAALCQQAAVGQDV